MSNPQPNAQQLYNLAQWGEGYFEAASNGDLLVKPARDDRSINLPALAAQLHEEGLELPVLVRFNDILHDRIDALTDAFSSVIAELGYQNHYTCVYPIKVNQQRSVVEAIVSHGGQRVGLEAGSKPELAAVLGLAPKGQTIVCNGYKDRAYIRRALIAEKLGHPVYIVVEKLSELPLILEESQRLNVQPRLGLRIRLSSLFASTQQNTGGTKSKFGLTTPQLLEALRLLKAANALDTVQMVHFHLGSQVANVQDVCRGLKEAARCYIELRRWGAPVAVVDVGGGLGVDYEGSRSRSHCSMNYSLREYARAIVRSLQEACAEAGQPEPAIISESGRALTAHHAVLITNVVDFDAIDTQAPALPHEDAPSVLHDLQALLTSSDDPLERLHDGAYFFDEAKQQYTQGQLDLEQRAHAESLYYHLNSRILPLLDDSIRAHREAADELQEKLALKYFCNFSVFQSVPDAWAIDQIFPIVPIHRLHESPTLRATLCDLTCDSDGKINSYVDRAGLMPTLPVHALEAGKPYLLGFFMVGAYQEILGDMHNLFGDTNAVNVSLTEGGYRISNAEHGDRTDELLRYVHLAPEELAQSYRKKLAASGLPLPERSALLAELEAGLTGYTYFSEGR
jgi:arginine decarboxylase